MSLPIKTGYKDFLAEIFPDKNFSPQTEDIAVGKRIEFAMTDRILQGTITDCELDQVIVDVGCSCNVLMPKTFLESNIICVHKNG